MPIKHANLCHHSWLGNHIIPPPPTLAPRFPNSCFFLPMGSFDEVFSPQLCIKPLQPPIHGNRCTVEPRPSRVGGVFFAMRWNPITINGTTRMTTPRGFLGQNLSKKTRFQLHGIQGGEKTIQKPDSDSIWCHQGNNTKYVAEVPCLLLPAVPSHPSDPAYAGTPDNAPNTVSVYKLSPFLGSPHVGM